MELEMGEAGLQSFYVAPPPIVRATRLVGAEKWQAEVLLTEQGVAIGYTGPRTSRSGRKRVMLGFAMGYVTDDDFRSNRAKPTCPPL